MLAFTLPAKLLAGLNAGMLWAGIVIVVFFEMLRATFSALFLTMKLPKPLRYTFLFFDAFHERFHDLLHLRLFDARAFCDFINDVRLSHNYKYF